MSGWYALVPAGAVAIGNLTPVGQNSGQVGCRWPPNGHQLAACLNLPTTCQLWGPFWHWNAQPYEIYLTLPQTTYHLASDRPNLEELPSNIFRSPWQNNSWQVPPEHQQEQLTNIGGEFLISGNEFQSFWQTKTGEGAELVPLSAVWQTLTLSHNSREQYMVRDEGGFFAEMTTLMQPGWSILVKIIGDYTPPAWGYLGAGATPVAINPIPRISDRWLQSSPSKARGAVLLTGALWQKQEPPEQDPPTSIPYPMFAGEDKICAYAAAAGVPWQSWKKVKHRQKQGKIMPTLTPGEWLTPPGAVYFWKQPAPVTKSEPLWDRFNRHSLGYGHLWLFE